MKHLRIENKPIWLQT